MQYAIMIISFGIPTLHPRYPEFIYSSFSAWLHSLHRYLMYSLCYFRLTVSYIPIFQCSVFAFIWKISLATSLPTVPAATKLLYYHVYSYSMVSRMFSLHRMSSHHEVSMFQSILVCSSYTLLFFGYPYQRILSASSIFFIFIPFMFS